MTVEKKEVDMKKKKRSLKFLFLTCLIVYLGIISFSTLAFANYAAEAEQLVEKSRFTFQNFASDPNMAVFLDLAKKARP